MLIFSFSDNSLFGKNRPENHSICSCFFRIFSDSVSREWMSELVFRPMFFGFKIVSLYFKFGIWSWRVWKLIFCLTVSVCNLMNSFFNLSQIHYFDILRNQSRLGCFFECRSHTVWDLLCSQSNSAISFIFFSFVSWFIWSDFVLKNRFFSFFPERDDVFFRIENVEFHHRNFDYILFSHFLQRVLLRFLRGLVFWNQFDHSFVFYFDLRVKFHNVFFDHTHFSANDFRLFFRNLISFFVALPALFRISVLILFLLFSSFFIFLKILRVLFPLFQSLSIPLILRFYFCVEDCDSLDRFYFLRLFSVAIRWLNLRYCVSLQLHRGFLKCERRVFRGGDFQDFVLCLVRKQLYQSNLFLWRFFSSKIESWPEWLVGS